MTGPVYTKRYQDPRRAAEAAAHREWLANLECEVRVPALRAADAHCLAFEHLGNRQPGPGDLELLAQALGRMHAAAYAQHLHAARLDQPFAVSPGLVIRDFAGPRREALRQRPLPVEAAPRPSTRTPTSETSCSPTRVSRSSTSTT
ncbi:MULTISPECIES: hypothetical protein [Amycolatopsis]|uniref:hypothetical protein n=1 Tax=Amycolatopsis TaxID=1813 RepID=UPI000AD3FE16|nr:MULTISPECIES: hypothetical protein [Amycolatopsis]